MIPYADLGLSVTRSARLDSAVGGRTPSIRCPAGVRGERRETAGTPETPRSEGNFMVLELFVRNLERSRRFYQSIGFHLRRSGARFAELVWEGTSVFLYQPPLARWAHSGEVDDTPRTNLRVPVRDVEFLWHQAQALGLRVLEPLADKPYGFRDFMVADPDGFGLRFASPLSSVPIPI